MSELVEEIGNLRYDTFGLILTNVIDQNRKDSKCG